MIMLKEGSETNVDERDMIECWMWLIQTRNSIDVLLRGKQDMTEFQPGTSAVHASLDPLQEVTAVAMPPDTQAYAFIIPPLLHPSSVLEHPGNSLPRTTGYRVHTGYRPQAR